MGYRPRIQRAGGTYDLPLPLLQSTEDFTRRIGTSDVPLQPGTLIRSSVIGAATVAFSGLIVVANPQDADRTGDVTTMVSDVMLERDKLIEWLTGSDEPFTFYRYVAGATIGGTQFGSTSLTRFYKNVLCSGLNFAHTHKSTTVLPYSFNLLVPDGVEYYV